MSRPCWSSRKRAANENDTPGTRTEPDSLHQLSDDMHAQLLEPGAQQYLAFGIGERVAHHLRREAQLEVEQHHHRGDGGREGGGLDARAALLHAVGELV